MAKQALLKADPDFIKQVRDEHSDEPENLEKRCLDFHLDHKILKGVIQQIQVFNAKLHETNDPEEKLKYERQISEFSNLANLQGLAGLYAGFGLLIDMLSIQETLEDDDGQELLTDKGEKVYVRTPILFDVAAYTDSGRYHGRRAANILFKMALKQNAVHEKQTGVDDQEAEAEILKVPASAGVPASDLVAAKGQPTQEQINNFVTGEKK